MPFSLLADRQKIRGEVETLQAQRIMAGRENTDRKAEQNKTKKGDREMKKVMKKVTEVERLQILKSIARDTANTTHRQAVMISDHVKEMLENAERLYEKAKIQDAAALKAEVAYDAYVAGIKI